MYIQEKKFTHQSFWKKHINRCVFYFSSDRLEDDQEYNIYQLRITHLVTADTTFEMIDDYLDFQERTDCQFTIKELVGYDDDGMYKKIKKNILIFLI